MAAQRCHHCQKRIGLFEYKCQACQSAFCVKCRLPEDHACDHLNAKRAQEKEELAKTIQESASKETHRLKSL